MGDEIEGAVQQAAHPGRQSMGALWRLNGGWVGAGRGRIGGTQQGPIPVKSRVAQKCGNLTVGDGVNGGQ